jgi:MinD-like ATPase involved in chromosome partitioning or flagellar assembly
VTDVITGLGPRWEAPVATLLERVPGVTIARRCADVAELLSVAEAGVGRIAVVSHDLRGLDLDVVSRLRGKGVRVIGLHPADDEPAQKRLRQLSVPTLLALDATVADFSAAVDDTQGGRGGPGGFDELLLGPDAAATGRPVDLAPRARPDTVHDRATDGSDGHTGTSDRDGSQHVLGLSGPTVRGGSDVGAPGPGASSGTKPSRTSAPDESDDGQWTGWRPQGDGSAQAPDRRPDGTTGEEFADGVGSVGARPERAHVVAVWGPTGAPGRTTVATTLAAEVASRGGDVLLVDADTYGGCIAQALGLLDEAPGIAAACRAAEQGSLDLPVLAGLAPQVVPGLRVLTGLPKAERWPEVRAAALERVLELSRSLVSLVVVDCGFCLEDDEELSYDTVAPRRNEATLTSLAAADCVIAVGGADPVALQRFVRGLQELGTVPSPPPLAVVNRVRSASVGSRPEARIAASLQRFAGLEDVRFVPDDPAAVDAAVLAGRSVVEQAPESPVRRAVGDLASVVAPWTAPTTRRRRRGSAGAGAARGVRVPAGLRALSRR